MTGGISDKIEMISNSLDETKNFAEHIADITKTVDVITLNGTLGAGKTSFAQFYIGHLTGLAEDIPSPTFTLVQEYETSKGTLFHLDLYRLNDAEEIFNLGWDDMVNNGIMLIEWAEKAEPYLPAKRFDIVFEILSPESRKISYIPILPTGA